VDAVQARLDGAVGCLVAARRPQQVAVLPLDFGPHQLARQPQARRLVGQRPVLADAPLHLTRRRHQAGHVVAGGGQPVDGDAVLDAPAQRLHRDLGEAVQQQRLDPPGWGAWFPGGARPDHRAVAAAPDMRPCETTCRVAPPRSGGKRRTGSRSGWRSWRTSSGRQAGASEQPAQRRSLSAIAEPLDTLAQARGLEDGGAEVVAGGVVADAALGDGLAEGVFQ
jgi:hypothetical protein